ncbi:MAG TPA: zinc ribbon domain-containing protein [Candidatus Angelobacter sp.]|nr:zinc ribbon domain-containing protein [Candidatus Angelobacter sp.]
MTRFSDELRIIPRFCWVLAVVVWVCVFFMLMFVAVPGDAKMRVWPLAGQVAFCIWPGILVGIFVLLICYINADARRRGMRHVMWTLLAIFVPNSIGIILYFVFRDPLLARCPKCGTQGRANFAFCPQCGTQLAPACPGCKRNVESGWQRCPYCGTGLGTAPPLATNQPNG